MLKLFVAILLSATCLLLPQNSFAQEAFKSKVLLKSGEKIEGKIIEAVPDKYIKIELADGTVRTIDAADIQEIQSEESVTNSEKRGLSVIAGIHTSFDFTSSLNYLFVEPRVILGWRIKNSTMWFGFSFLYGKSLNYEEGMFGFGDETTRESVKFFPVFMNSYTTFGKKKVKPSIDISAGYPISINGKEYLFTVPAGSSSEDEYNAKIKSRFYLQIAPGVSIAMGKKAALNIALQYHLLLFKEAVDKTRIHYSTRYGTDEVTAENRTANSIGVSVNIVY